MSHPWQGHGATGWVAAAAILFGGIMLFALAMGWMLLKVDMAWICALGNVVLGLSMFVEYRVQRRHGNPKYAVLTLILSVAGLVLGGLSLSILIISSGSA